jgi:catechol 2,3-dioxygenase-like lactoylglutathione lyase family enzyme
MKPVGVHHVAINVADAEEAIAFYVDRLGLVRREDRPDFGPGAWLDAGSQQLHLVESPAPPDVGQHFALQVADIDDAITELRDNGIEVTDAFSVGNTSRQAFLKDPSGNAIELHEVAR